MLRSIVARLPRSHAVSARRPQLWSLALGARGYAKSTGKPSAGRKIDLNEADALKTSATKRLLDDNLLERAGMDVDTMDRPQAENTGASQTKAADGKGSAEDAHEPDEADESEGSRKKWENTARKARDESSVLERRKYRTNIFYFLSGLTVVGLIAYSARKLDEEEVKRYPNVSNENTVGGYFERIKTRVVGTFDTFNDPAFEKLLPDPLPAPYGRPLTLVLALEDLLVRSEWTREHGWRTAKRPGVDYFLGYLAQYYEVVIFSTRYQAIDQEIVLKLDPMRASVSYPLFREATRFHKGKIVKDISHLNRDLSKVIVVDVDPDAVSLQPENALLLHRWKGNPDDTDLIRLIPLLEWIGAQPVKDVRPILKSYANCDVLDEFERREVIARERWEASRDKAKSGSWASKFLGVVPNKAADLMPQDFIRQEGQRGYLQFQKYLKEHGPQMLAEEEARQKEALGEQKMTLNKLIKEGAPTQEDIAAAMARKEEEARLTAEERQAAILEGKPQGGVFKLNKN